MHPRLVRLHRWDFYQTNCPNYRFSLWETCPCAQQVDLEMVTNNHRGRETTSEEHHDADIFEIDLRPSESHKDNKHQLPVMHEPLSPTSHFLIPYTWPVFLARTMRDNQIDPSLPGCTEHRES